MIGSSGAASADVDWYQFDVAVPATVTLAANRPFAGVVSLYNNDSTSPNDPENTLGHRLLAQKTGSTPIRETLAPGSYWVAVSGAGNRYFNPFIAGSGDRSQPGAYELTISARPRATSAGPQVLAANPAEGTVHSHAPLVVRVGFDTALDPNTVNPGSTVQLVYSPTATFLDATTRAVPLAWFNFSSSADELQLAPAAPLRPGYYEVRLAGHAHHGTSVLTDPNGVPLGKDARHPLGQDVTLHFRVGGIEGGGAADDRPATAHELGDLTQRGLVQVAGTIGDDPAYHSNLANPANDVDFYHFRITGPGRYALVADVFAGRIGSGLDSGVSLFRAGSNDGPLSFIDGNDNSLNGTVSTNDLLPLYSDATLTAGLTAGDYYVAVSSGGNTPERALNDLPGAEGIFDPSRPHSGTAGATVGPYVLNLLLRADDTAPSVASTTPDEGTTLDAAPTELSVQFSEPVNVPELAYDAFLQTSDTTLSPVYVEAADGTRYFPRLAGYDAATNRARFQMLDGLPNGVYRLHLSGALGLTDLAGNPLAGNDPSGDSVVTFTVNRSAAASPALGVLFPHDLEAGVTLTRDSGAGHGDQYPFQVLQNRTYAFLLAGAAVPPGTTLTLTGADGRRVPVTPMDHAIGLLAQLDAGSYVLGVGGWFPGAGRVSYRLRIGLAESGDNPPPLTIGPRPATAVEPAAPPPPNTGARPPGLLPDSLAGELTAAARVGGTIPAVAADTTPATTPAHLAIATRAAGTEALVSPSRPAPTRFDLPPGMAAHLGTDLINAVPGPASQEPPQARSVPNLLLTPELLPPEPSPPRVGVAPAGAVEPGPERVVAAVWQPDELDAPLIAAAALEPDGINDPIAATTEPGLYQRAWNWTMIAVSMVASGLITRQVREHFRHGEHGRREPAARRGEHGLTR
jgi:hypothetical protein